MLEIYVKLLEIKLWSSENPPVRDFEEHDSDRWNLQQGEKLKRFNFVNFKPSDFTHIKLRQANVTRDIFW